MRVAVAVLLLIGILGFSAEAYAQNQLAPQGYFAFRLYQNDYFEYFHQYAVMDNGDIYCQNLWGSDGGPNFIGNVWGGFEPTNIIGVSHSLHQSNSTHFYICILAGDGFTYRVDMVVTGPNHDDVTVGSTSKAANPMLFGPISAEQSTWGSIKGQ